MTRHNFIQWPYDFDKSPFHIKGIVYKNAIELYDQKIDGGYAALLKTIDDPELVAYLDQKFLVSSWYDVFPLTQLSRYACKILDISFEELSGEGCG